MGKLKKSRGNLNFLLTNLFKCDIINIEKIKKRGLNTMENIKNIAIDFYPCFKWNVDKQSKLY